MACGLRAELFGGRNVAGLVMHTHMHGRSCIIYLVWRARSNILYHHAGQETDLEDIEPLGLKGTASDNVM